MSLWSRNADVNHHAKNGKAKKRKKNGDLKTYGQGIRAETRGGKSEVLAVGNNCRKLFYINTLNMYFAKLVEMSFTFRKGYEICSLDWEVEQETQFYFHGLYDFSVGIKVREMGSYHWKKLSWHCHPEARKKEMGHVALTHISAGHPRLLPVQWLTLSRMLEHWCSYSSLLSWLHQGKCFPMQVSMPSQGL